MITLPPEYDRTRCTPNESAGYCYIDVPKAACTSIKTAIAKHRGISFQDVRRDYRYGPFAETTKLFRFSFVRNPFERLVSLWTDMLQPPFPERELRVNRQLRTMAGWRFEDVVQTVSITPDNIANRHFRTQDALFWWRDQRIVDEVYRLEDIDEVWPRLQERFGLPAIEHLRQSEHRPWQEYYDEPLFWTVKERYKHDLQYGY